MILTEMRKESTEKRMDRAEKSWNRRSMRESDFEERITYRTITRTEFQKRRASFEKDVPRALKVKTRSMDELPKTELDPYRIQYQEKEMTDKLEDIHQMIKDMQELTRQLKAKKRGSDEKPRENAQDSGKLLSVTESSTEIIPTRYKSTILMAIGSKWQRFKEEIELQIKSVTFVICPALVVRKGKILNSFALKFVMDPDADSVSEGSGNSTLNFIRSVLVSLCANFNALYIPEGDWECKFRPEYYYQLRSLRGKTFKFTTLQKLPLSGTEVDNSTGEIRGVGIAFDVIHEIQRRVGFYYNITLPEENGIGNENLGVMKMLHTGEVDMAVVFIPVAEIFRKYASFSSTLAEFEWVLMMARPSASASGSGLLAPFQGMVWVLILISLIIAGPTMYLIVFLRSKFYKNTGESRKQYSLSSCIWFVYGALMKQGSTLSPVSDSPRLFFATWWIFITILTSFYTANLTAFLTLSEFTLTIQTPKDIYTHNRKWMADKGGYTEALVNHEEIFRLVKKTSVSRGKFIDESSEQKLQDILTGTIYISEKRKAQSFILRDYMNKVEKKIPENKRCTYVLTPRTILTKTVAFGYSKNSTLQSLFDPLLTYFVHAGIIGHLLDKSLPLTTICPLNLATRERKLKNSDLLTTYKVVIIGFASSFIAFAGEVIHRMAKNGCKRKSEKTKTGQKERKNKNHILNYQFQNKGSQFKNTLDNDLLISNYYREILMPYSLSSRNLNGFQIEQERSAGHLIPTNQPTNFLFQYTN